VRFEVLGVMPSPGALLAGVVTSQFVKQVVTSTGALGGSPGTAREAVVELVKVAGVALPFVIAV
jgi:oligosaccharide translocation protein RFT1